MCADGVNFGDYLVRNEKWLTTGNETSETKEVDGKLSDNEVSIFFSSSHINSDGDGEISYDEFDNWYKANESAISAYLNDIGEDYDDSNIKSAMLESMNEFMQNSQYSDIELMHLSDETEKTTLGQMKTPDSETLQEENKLGEVAQKYYDKLKDIYNIKNSVDYNKNIKNILSEISADNELSHDEKLAILEEFSLLDKSQVQDYLKNNDEIFINYINEISSNDDFSTENIIELTKRYNMLQGDTDINFPQSYQANETFINNLIKVYQQAGADENVQELIKNGFIKPSTIAKNIQSSYSFSKETNMLKDLMHAIGSDKPTKLSDYGITDNQYEAYKAEYRNSPEEIIRAVKDKKLSKEHALGLLQNIYQGDVSALVENFRSNFASVQNELIESLFDIYS